MKYCSDGEDQARPIDVNGVKYCVAQCLELTEDTNLEKSKGTECFYNSTTMKLKGCPAKFNPEISQKTILCNDGINSSKLISDTWKVCDYMVFTLYTINQKTYALEKNDDISETLKRMKVAKKMGIKAVLYLGGWNHSRTISKIADDAKLRDDFINRTTNTILNHNMDGIYVDWIYPGCPQGDCKNRKVDRPNTAAFYSGFGKVLKKFGKINMVKVAPSPIMTFQAGDYFSDIFQFVDFYYAQVESLSGHWLPNAELHSNLALVKIGIDVFFKRLAEPNKVRSKLIMGLTLQTTAYDLVDKTAVKIGTQHTKKASFLPLSEWCELVEADSGYKVVKDREKQNYAVKDGHLFVYDDVDSLKAKVEYFQGLGGAGFFIFGTSYDDPYGECGCGNLPRLKAIGELVKSKTCEPLLCP